MSHAEEHRVETAGWEEASRRHLSLETERLKALLRGRVEQLREAWRQDPLAAARHEVTSDELADQLLAAAGRPPSAEQPVEAANLRKEIAALEAEIQGSLESARRTGVIPGLALLAEKFGLTAFEREVIVLCAAAELDGGFERLYGYVQDDMRRTFATPRLALEVFAGSPDATIDAFLADGPLRRFQLVHAEATEGALAIRPMYLDERVMAFLQGINRLDARVAHLLRSLPAVPASAAHRELSARLAATVRRDPARTAVQLIGARGHGRAAVAAELAADLQLAPVHLDIGRLPTATRELQQMLQLLEREATLLGLLLYVEAGEPADGSSTSIAAVLLDDLYAPLAVATPSSITSDRPAPVVRVPKPGAAEQRRLWSEVLGPVDADIEDEVGRLVEQFDFGPSEIARTVAAARALAVTRAPHEGALAAADLWSASRELTGLDLASLGQRIEPCYDWDDIVLPADAIASLRDIAAQVEHRYGVYEEWGFGEKLNRGRGIAALFAGRSGTGKTMAAEVLANDLQLDLYRIDLAGVVSKYIGETEKNLKRVFDAAQRSGAILFFDEADALFGKRTEVKDSHDRYANIEVNYLLQRMEDYRGLAILATNRKGDLDGAFLRRLRAVIEFPFPDPAARKLIWRKVFPAQAPLDELDFDALARLEIAGGSIRNIALNAAFAARATDTSISMEQLMRAAQREYVKLERLVSRAEFGTPGPRRGDR